MESMHFRFLLVRSVRVARNITESVKRLANVCWIKLVKSKETLIDLAPGEERRGFFGNVVDYIPRIVEFQMDDLISLQARE